MKRIGYINNYSEVEKKGILVYGRWDETSYLYDRGTFLFSDLDCISKIETGQLVYFEIKEGKIGKIERASLANFDKKVIEEIITEKDRDLPNWYYQKTNISYENLNNIVQPFSNNDKEKSKEIHLDDFDLYDIDLDDIDLDDIDLDDIDLDDKFTTNVSNNSSVISNKDNYEPVQLPENINEIYNCFGKYKHNSYGHKSIIIQILDISLWLDKEIGKGKCFGKNIDELKYLYEIFIEKQRIDKKRNVITPKRENDCISPSWKLLLSKLSDDVLITIPEQMPLLQPALPIKFCKTHLGLLTNEYGMPNITICKMYCLHIIKESCSISDYL